MSKIRLIKLVVLTLIFATVLFVSSFIISRESSIKSKNELTKDQPKAQLILPVVLFKQWDPKWAKDKIGGSSEQILYVGCTLCSTAMVFDYFGVETTPKKLNNYLRANNGYTNNGWLRWYNAAEYTKGEVGVNYIGGPDHSVIEENLKNKIPVIVKIVLPGGIQHWVVIVGKNKDGYLVNDPLGTEKTAVPLSTLGEKIISMRIFKPALKT
jgi:uncharacterized protein YvpB